MMKRKADRKHIIDFFNLVDRITVPKRIKGKVVQVECVEPVTNKYFKSLSLVFHNEEFIKDVQKLRQERGIDTASFNRRRADWSSIVNAKYDIQLKIEKKLNRQKISFKDNPLGYIEASNKLEITYNLDDYRKRVKDHQHDCIEWADARLKFSDIDAIRIKHELPPHWEEAIIHFILTNELILPGRENYEPTYSNGAMSGFVLTIYADTTDTHLRILHTRLKKMMVGDNRALTSKLKHPIYNEHKIKGVVDKYSVEVSGLPTVRALMEIRTKCQNAVMQGGWIKNRRQGKTLKEHLNFRSKYVTKKTTTKKEDVRFWKHKERFKEIVSK